MIALGSKANVEMSAVRICTCIFPELEIALITSNLAVKDYVSDSLISSGK
jgi:hypothetical protein